MLKFVHVDALAAELYALHLQACFLFVRSLVTQFDLAPGSQHSMPGEMVGRIRAQQPGYGAMVERITGRRCHAPIGAYLARRNGENDTAKSLIPKFVRARAPSRKILRFARDVGTVGRCAGEACRIDRSEFLRALILGGLCFWFIR
jgi:hypothetical protein